MLGQRGYEIVGTIKQQGHLSSILRIQCKIECFLFGNVGDPQRRWRTFDSRPSNSLRLPGVWIHGAKKEVFRAIVLPCRTFSKQMRIRRQAHSDGRTFRSVPYGRRQDSSSIKEAGPDESARAVWLPIWPVPNN